MRKFFTLQFNVNTYYPLSQKEQNSLSEKFENNDELIKAPDNCVQNILNFARSYRVVGSKSAGKVEMILN